MQDRIHKRKAEGRKKGREGKGGGGGRKKEDLIFEFIG